MVHLHISFFWFWLKFVEINAICVFGKKFTRLDIFIYKYIRGAYLNSTYISYVLYYIIPGWWKLGICKQLHRIYVFYDWRRIHHRYHRLPMSTACSSFVHTMLPLGRIYWKLLHEIPLCPQRCLLWQWIALARMYFIILSSLLELKTSFPVTHKIPTLQIMIPHTDIND